MNFEYSSNLNNTYSNAKTLRSDFRCGTQDAMTMHFNAFLSDPVEATACGAAHSKYSGKRDHQRRDIVYVKTATKSFTQNTYLLNFLLALHSSAYAHACLESM